MKHTSKQLHKTFLVPKDSLMYYLHGSQPESGDFLLSFGSLLAQQHGFLFRNSGLLC
jgi:hypothetical protein